MSDRLPGAGDASGPAHHHQWSDLRFAFEDDHPWMTMRCGCGAERRVRAFERSWQPDGPAGPAGDRPPPTATPHPAAPRTSPVIRRLEATELPSVAVIDVTEADDTILVQHGRAISERHEPWSRGARDPAAWRTHIALWQATLAVGGVAWGANLDGRLVGVIILRRRVRPATDQLQALFVDRAARRRGIAMALIRVLEAESRAGGAGALVVSATPSRSAVGTYLRAGFLPSDDPVPELLALEPEDIHLEKAL